MTQIYQLVLLIQSPVILKYYKINPRESLRNPWMIFDSYIKKLHLNPWSPFFDTSTSSNPYSTGTSICPPLNTSFTIPLFNCFEYASRRTRIRWEIGDTDIVTCIYYTGFFDYIGVGIRIITFAIYNYDLG